MKKVIYLLFALFISGATLMSADMQTYNKYGQKVSLKVEQEVDFKNENVLLGPVSEANAFVKSGDKLQGVPASRATTLVPQMPNSLFNWNYRQSMANPISYDPTLGQNGMIAVMNMEPDYSGPGPGGGGGPSALTLSMYYSLDKGYTWTPRDSVGVYPTTPFYYTSPSMGITNTDKSMQIGGLESGVKETFDYVIYSRNFSSTDFNYTGMGMFINLGLEDEPFVSDFRNPSVNNSPDVQMWGFANVATSNADGNSGIYFISQMSPDPFELFQYGYYGNIGLSTSTGGLTGDIVPSVFWADKFRPSTSLSGSFQTRPNLSTDQFGNLYMAANNMPSNDPDNRTPMVWKSTDGGDSWGQPNICPLAIVQEVGNNLGNGNTSYGFTTNVIYSQDAFIAYGNDEYSYFIRMYSADADGNGMGIHIVELSYRSGVWSGRKVADVSENIGNKQALPTWLSHFSDLSWRWGGNDSIQVPLLEQLNNRGHEIQAAVTADGNSIVVKYLDWAASKTVTFDSTYTYYTLGLNDFGLEDTIAVQVNYDLPNDIFMVTRDLSSTQWSPEYNVTNDNWNYRNTYIPAIVPSKTEVPIVMSNSTLVTNPASRWYNAIGKLPTSFWSQVSWVWFQAIDIANVDATRNASAGPSPWDVQSVTNTINNDFKLLDPYPNPTNLGSGDVEISFILNNPGYVKIHLTDVMGRNVGVVYEGNLNTGSHGLNYNTNNLSTGTYYLNLSVENNVATKILNVIK
jgi:hypothetical protein